MRLSLVGTRRGRTLTATSSSRRFMLRGRPAPAQEIEGADPSENGLVTGRSGPLIFCRGEGAYLMLNFTQWARIEPLMLGWAAWSTVQ